eukprot:scaffold112156_cov33-Tisochrysis_lutea.AAC.1
MESFNLESLPIEWSHAQCDKGRASDEDSVFPWHAASHFETKPALELESLPRMVLKLAITMVEL